MAEEPPKKATMENLKTSDFESSDSDDHFSDAQSGIERSGAVTPIVRVEKVDDEPRHGEVPGTEAFHMREADAVPDEVEIIGKSKETEAKSTAHSVLAAVADGGSRTRSRSTPGDLPIPITKVEKVNSEPSHGEIPGTEAYELRKGDAEPDIVEEIGDAPGSPTGDRSPNISHARRKSSGAGRQAVLSDYNEEEDGDFGDDFDDFEEGEDDAEFGDFDDGFQEAEPAQTSQVLPAVPSFHVFDFTGLDSEIDIQTAAEPYMSALFPPDSIDTSVLPPASAEHSVFLSQRSASLWAQLVAPPPLQPPNWIRSRIRRLFLVSLGVPVDLDEILPASKQKKLILPSMHLIAPSGSPRNSTDTRSISRLKQEDGNGSTTSIDSQGKQRSDSRRRKGPAPAPQLDLVSARQLCMITDEALNGLTMEELKEHISKLEAMEGIAKEVLEYWTKRTDEKLGDREAFEGVIENLVKHARKVRK